jgi:hypothetical protein
VNATIEKVKGTRGTLVLVTCPTGHVVDMVPASLYAGSSLEHQVGRKEVKCQIGSALSGR